MAVSDRPLYLSVRVKKMDPAALLPSRSHATDAAHDLTALDDGQSGEEGYLQYRTGLAMEPPSGHHLQIYPRSSISCYDLVMCNSVPLIDEGYRGEICIRFRIVPPCRLNSAGHWEAVFVPALRLYRRGDRIAQILVCPTLPARFDEVARLSSSDRAAGGFGSSGR
jgi:dUTP pyrophosphatase